MVRRRIVQFVWVISALALAVGPARLAWSQTQVKPTAPVPINKPAAKAQVMKPLDINSASEEDIVALGVEKAVAKKIVEGRPYRNKTELVSRSLLTRDQYEKLKDDLVAKQPPKGK